MFGTGSQENAGGNLHFGPNRYTTPPTIQNLDENIRLHIIHLYNNIIADHDFDRESNTNQSELFLINMDDELIPYLRNLDSDIRNIIINYVSTFNDSFSRHILFGMTRTDQLTRHESTSYPGHFYMFNPSNGKSTWAGGRTNKRKTNKRKTTKKRRGTNKKRRR